MRRAAVIMAGGSGTRLWPLSRRSRPKQLLRLFDGRSTLYRAFERLAPIVPAEDIYVIALAEHLPAIADELPMLPPKNLIGEPMARDTANAIATCSAILHEIKPDTVMGVFTADHLIRPVDKFVDAVNRGYAAAEAHATSLITFGIRPTSAHSGMGYLERGPQVADGLWRVASFKEKPDVATAQRFLAAGHVWNSGMFVWRTTAILSAMERLLPASLAAARKIASQWKSGMALETATALYPALEKISIDFAVMEKSPDVMMIEMPVEWFDVGNWSALPAIVPTDADGNTKTSSQVALLSGRDNIIVAEDNHLIAAIGVDNLIVVHSKDATLICPRDQEQRVRELVAFLQKEHGDRYL
jgi:mannose-1-phosphate guanylyltransferase